jgi:hypothetical protein
MRCHVSALGILLAHARLPFARALSIEKLTRQIDFQRTFSTMITIGLFYKVQISFFANFVIHFK